MPSPKVDLLQGTLNVIVLQTLERMGPLQAYGIASRIEQVSQHAILLNQGTIIASPALLQHRGWISADWRVSEHNREAKSYSITNRIALTGRKWRKR